MVMNHLAAGLHVIRTATPKMLLLFAATATALILVAGMIAISGHDIQSPWSNLFAAGTE